MFTKLPVSVSLVQGGASGSPLAEIEQAVLLLLFSWAAVSDREIWGFLR
jgi:hypothetical protein